ncbi:CDP-glycerol glycerophosphotransferase family protein [Propionicimonas sp.]|uniref:CDP-glycerol glycerophosphotransferase family protein n=1 Tax=Propionicimonas sp. TaxID=1955623 RepID=UPI0039E3BB45
MPHLLSTGFSSIRYIFRAVGGISILADLLAVATVIVTLAAPQSPAAAVLLALTTLVLLAWIGTEAAPSLRGIEPLKQLMGTFGTARILVVVAALGLDLGTGVSVGAIVAAALLGAMIIGESAMRRAVRGAVPQSANIPGWDVPLPSVVLADSLFAVNLLGMALMVVSAGFGLTQLPAVLAALAGLVLAVLFGIQSVRYLYRRNRFEANLPKILDKLAPAFCFHWQAPAGTAYQASMWLPYLDRIGLPYFVLVRTAANFAEVSKLTDAPVILRVGLEDLDAVSCASLKAVFYANTAVRNSHMIRFPHLTHIQLNHGDSDKIASVSPTFRQYDKNFVAGQAAIDRFAKHGVVTRSDQFEIVGRPQLEDVRAATGPISAVGQPTVLYSPTWSGFYEDSDYSSLRAGRAIVAGLLERGCTVVFRPHPYARRHKGNAEACDSIIELLTLDAASTGRTHIFGPAAETEMSVVDCFNASDAMVSDVSSLLSDYLVSGKPFAMAAVSAHGDAFVDEFPLAEAAYVFDVVGADAVGFSDLLGDLLDTDPKAAVRRSLRDYYLSDTPTDHVVEHFVEVARRYLS